MVRTSVVFLGLVLFFAPVTGKAESVDLSSKCTQKNQGGLGTCHAFALSCPIEAFEAKKNPGYEVSGNWLVFVSVMDRICTSGNRPVRVNEGYSAVRNVARLMDLGYCSAKRFTRYDPWDRARSTAGPAAGGAPGEIFKEGEIEHPSEADEVYQAMTAASPGARGIMSPMVAQKFRKAFGITYQAARYALCSGSDAEKTRRINAAPDVAPEFQSCFREAMIKKQQLTQSCSPEATNTRLTSAQKVRSIKQRLDKGEPVIISMHEYQVGGDPKHNYHALSIVGYDDRKQQFIVRNSWGRGANYPIPYRRVPKILGLASLNCKAGRDLAGFKPHSTVAQQGSVSSTEFH